MTVKHHFLKITNFTTVTEFLLTGFAEKWEISLLLSLLFLLMYLVTLIGNILIISATTVDQNLHTPMYFFLRNLSIPDVCYVSVTVPNACVNYVTNNWAISVASCATQIFLVIYFAIVEILFLMFMACDRYMAICQPLHYPVIMNHQFCVRMTLFSLLSGLLYSGAHTGLKRLRNESIVWSLEGKATGTFPLLLDDCMTAAHAFLGHLVSEQVPHDPTSYTSLR
ncbi:olfactory receptor 14C36-like [Manis javanica]|uniref:olfactory receptor 14C36-like n=1 Tax=Manis javanica TaxID=9974 RepID=UPI003C6D1DB7